MNKNSFTRIVSIGIVGQVLCFLIVAIIGQLVVPCCRNMSPEVPMWFSYLSSPLYFFSILVPGYFIGRLEHSRFAFAGIIVGAVGSIIWSVIGAFLMLQIFPERAVSELGTISSVLHSIGSLEVMFSFAITASCQGLAACTAACAGHVFSANHAFERDASESPRPSI
ncbi:hypothetical protein [Undibacterium sp. Ren11W]|uniref:hypothetical protein n=1 Tax=Undibacterium sp. Ren11W TaxID=3413045 RepID=UPI003BF5346D